MTLNGLRNGPVLVWSHDSHCPIITDLGAGVDGETGGVSSDAFRCGTR